MKRMAILRTCLLAIFVGLAASCGAPAPEESKESTIREIMGSMVDPSADFLFESVYQISDENGIRDIEPRTDQEWAEVRRHAQVLFDAPALITSEGRLVANPGETAPYPEVELQPVDIQKMIDADHASFERRAKRLQDAAAKALTAIDKKDKNELFQALINIDHACENCHLHYWYPNDKRAWEQAKEEGLIVD